jgi:hypothetical protein
MRQPNLKGLPAFADSPVDMPYGVVADCNSESEAVAYCIDFAREMRGLSQRQIALMCGWRSESYLSEIASEANEKRMPDKRVGLFALATGTNLLSQWREKQEADRKRAGKATATDRARIVVAAMCEAARQAA